ncbi:MAG TPA: hypothetical protein VGB91_13145 [Rhizomicrobium sp.]
MSKLIFQHLKVDFLYFQFRIDDGTISGNPYPFWEFHLIGNVASCAVLERALKCPRCGQTGAVRLEQVRTPSETKLLIVGIEGRFVRAEQANANGQPIVRCDLCDTELPVDRRKGDDEAGRTHPPGDASGRRDS